MEYDIIFPDTQKIVEMDRAEIIKYLKKKPTRCAIIILTYMFQPCTIKELRNAISSHFKTFPERGTIHDWCRTLEGYGLIEIRLGKEVLMTDNHSDITNKIRKKYLDITKNFDIHNKREISFFSISEKGKSYIEFCGEVLGIEVKCKTKI